MLLLSHQAYESHSQQPITNSQSSLDFRTAVDLMLTNNNAIKAAEKNTALAKHGYFYFSI